MSTTTSLDRCSCGSPTQSRDHLKMKQQQQQQQPQQQHSNDTSESINHDIIKENAIKDQQTTRNVTAVVQMNDNCSNDKFINLKDNGISDTKEFIDSKNASTVATMTTTSKTERNLMTSRRRSTSNVYKKMSASKSSPVRNNKESEKSIPGVNNEKINDEQINDENMQASNENERSHMESDPSSSRNYCKNETANKTEKDLDYTALSYDVNYVKVSPPRLTRRPKKSDDGNDVGNKPDVKLESSFVKRDKSQPKRLQKAPAKSPEKEIAVEDENEIAAKNSTSTKENESQNVLELTFTVVLDKETLKNVRRNINLSESDESDDKNRTEEVQLDETSQRIVAETITEVLAKTGQLGNVINSNALTSSMNLASVNNDKNDCTLTKNINVINEPNFDKYKLNEKIHQASEGTKNISSLKNVQPSNVKMTDKTQNAEVAQKETTQLTYQTLEHQLPTRTLSSQTQHQNASQRQFKSLDETYNSKKYQTLSNFSPKQNRIVTEAQVHASFDAECLPSKNKNDPHYFHGRFVSNICDYGKENHLSVKNHKKYPTNGYFQEWSGHSINNIAVEDEQTHMNWDDLMKEAKSLGIPLKRPGVNEEKPKRSSNSFSNRLLSSFGANAGNRKSDMNMAKSICGGELGRSVYFDDYDYRTSSVVYHCSYGPKKSSPSKEKLRLVDFLFGRNRSTKSFDEDCPLCKKQSSSQYGHHSCSGHNYSKTASSKKSAFSNLHKQSKYRCTKNSCPECVCTCFDAYHKTGATRSSSSPPPASTLKIKHKDGNNNNYYEGKLKECYNSQHVGQVGIVGKVSAPCKSDSCCQDYWANNNHNNNNHNNNNNYNTNNSISYNVNKNIVDAYNQLDAGYRSLLSPRRLPSKNKQQQQQHQQQLQLLQQQQQQQLLFNNHYQYQQQQQQVYQQKYFQQQQQQYQQYHLSHVNNKSISNNILPYKPQSRMIILDNNNNDDVFISDDNLNDGDVVDEVDGDGKVMKRKMTTMMSSREEQRAISKSGKAETVNTTRHNSAGFLKSLQLLKDKDWYWGSLNFEEAEMKLSKSPDGWFLVRDSSDERYILSVSFRSEGRTHHTRIEHHSGVFSFYTQRMKSGSTTSENAGATLSQSSTVAGVGASTSIVEFIEDAVRRSKLGECLYYLPGSISSETPPTPVKLLYPLSRFADVSKE